MKKTIINCFCDNCNVEMTESFYEERAVRLNIQADVPDPGGRSREVSGCQMRLCDTCSESIGIIKKEIYASPAGTSSVGDKARLKEAVINNSRGIVQMLTKYLKK